MSKGKMLEIEHRLENAHMYLVAAFKEIAVESNDSPTSFVVKPRYTDLDIDGIEDLYYQLHEVLKSTASVLMRSAERTYGEQYD